MSHIGFGTESLSYKIISKYSGIVIFTILGIVDMKTIRETFNKKMKDISKSLRKHHYFLFYFRSQR